MKHLSTSTSPQSGDSSRRTVAIGSVLPTRNGRRVVTTVTAAGASGRVITSGGAR